MCLTVLLICCILKARNCKNIHRNTYSTNRDIYCKTIVAFLECFFMKLQKGQKSFYQNIYIFVFQFLIEYKVYAVMCIGLSKTHLIALLTIMACPRALKYATRTTIGYHGEQRSISCMNSLIYSWSPKI